MVKGDGDIAWGRAVVDILGGMPERVYEGGRGLAELCMIGDIARRADPQFSNPVAAPFAACEDTH